MDEDTKKERDDYNKAAASSKKDGQKARDEMGGVSDDCQDSDMTSGSSASSRSIPSMVNSRLEELTRNKSQKKSPRKEPKPARTTRKKRGRPGRIQKNTTVRRGVSRKRLTAQQRAKRREKRERQLKKRRNPVTRISSRSRSPVMSCKYCGHRCCQRRYESRQRYRRRRKPIAKKRRPQRKEKNKMKVIAAKHKGPTYYTRCIQIGSGCLALSPLCVGTSATSPVEEKGTMEEKARYCKVTPEIIHESIKKLTMWKQEIDTFSLLDHIKMNYPVCQDSTQLLTELEEKLCVASMVGIVTCTKRGNWCLNCALQNRKLTTNHVTMFWDMYADTMKPLPRKPVVIVDKNDRYTDTSNSEPRARYMDIDDIT